MFKLVKASLPALLLSASAALATVAPAVVAQPAAAATVTRQQTRLSPVQFERRLLRQLNRVRRAHSLVTLQHGPCAARVAERWARHMSVTDNVVTENIYRVAGSCGKSSAGEIVDAGYQTPHQFVTEWMTKWYDRESMLGRDFRRAGVGAVYADGKVYVMVVLYSTY